MAQLVLPQVKAVWCGANELDRANTNWWNELRTGATREFIIFTFPSAKFCDVSCVALSASCVGYLSSVYCVWLVIYNAPRSLRVWKYYWDGPGLILRVNWHLVLWLKPFNFHNYKVNRTQRGKQLYIIFKVLWCSWNQLSTNFRYNSSPMHNSDSLSQWCRNKPTATFPKIAWMQPSHCGAYLRNSRCNSMFALIEWVP